MTFPLVRVQSVSILGCPMEEMLMRRKRQTPQIETLFDLELKRPSWADLPAAAQQEVIAGLADLLISHAGREPKDREGSAVNE
jgi:hypothetical protein